MTRLLDILLAAAGLILGAPFLVLIALAGWLDTGSPLFRQQRLGREKRPFTLMKFRTMPIATASVGTHLLDASVITPMGRFLRSSKLDELPQLWNVIRGEMSLVGPRPCLPEQHELIRARDALGVFRVRPGITGLAQLQGIDMSTPERLASTDAEMLAQFGLGFYGRCLLRTLLGQGRGDRVKADDG